MMENKRPLSSIINLCDQDEEVVQVKRGRMSKENDSTIQKVDNPLEDSRIVSKILNYLNIQELKTARLVCKSFSREGGKHLLSKSYLQPSPDIMRQEKAEFVKEFNQFISLGAGESRKLGLILHEDLLFILKNLPDLAQRVVRLKYNGPNPHRMMEFIQALEKLPHLEILCTNTMYLFPKNIDYIVARGKYLTSFLNKLETLKEIWLRFPLGNFIETWSFPKKGVEIAALKLKAVTRILIDDDNHPDSVLEFLLSPRFHGRISHLNWNLRDPLRYSPLTISLVFTKFSKTLKYLKVGIRDGIFNILPWSDNFVIPLSLSRLETMVIHGTAENTWLLLTIALRLPNLKQIVLHHLPQKINQKIHIWENHPSANGRKLQSLSIKEVELNLRIFILSYQILNGNLWPEMKSLKVRTIPVKMMTSQLFFCWRNLEYLDLDFTNLECWNCGPYEEWICGGFRSPKNYQSGTVFVQPIKFDTDFPRQLRDLKNLKSLSLRNPKKGFCGGDFLIYNCFQFMKNLQSLHLFCVKDTFSEKALSDLKQSLVIGVSIIVENY